MGDEFYQADRYPLRLRLCGRCQGRFDEIVRHAGNTVAKAVQHRRGTFIKQRVVFPAGQAEAVLQVAGQFARTQWLNRLA